MPFEILHENIYLCKMLSTKKEERQENYENQDNWLRLCQHAIFISLHLSKLESTKNLFFPLENSLANSRHTHAYSHIHARRHTQNTHTHANIHTLG